METYSLRPMGKNVRCRWVYDEDYRSEGSYAYDTEAETAAAVDYEKEKLQSEEWVALGCIVETRCEHCDEWKATDSLWGIVIDPTNENLDAFARDSMDLP